jgi:hypothetical protein
LFYSVAHWRLACLAELTRRRRLTVIDVHHTLLDGNDQSDRWLMQTVLKHSSSDQARAAAAAWLDAYDAAVVLGAATAQAQVLADAAYRATTTLVGLPTGDWRQS